MRRAVGTLVTDIHQAIMPVRGKRVMLDADLAALYGVPTKALVQAVRRNTARFPEDFMFRLTRSEVEDLRSHIVTSSGRHGWGGRRHLPHAFTEQGVAMLSSVLRSRRAIEVNINIIWRSRTKARMLAFSNDSLRSKVEELEKKYDANFKVVFDVIRALMSPPTAPPKEIGFRPSSRHDENHAQTVRPRILR
jgi:hypothetical protein